MSRQFKSLKILATSDNSLPSAGEEPFTEEEYYAKLEKNAEIKEVYLIFSIWIDTFLVVAAFVLFVYCVTQLCCYKKTCNR